MTEQPVIRSRREAKVYAIAVIAGFILVPVLVICTFATGSWLFLLLAVIVGFVATRYNRHLSAYSRHQKETH
jgi:1,4-dihydroxy-2-naphthoate octaprenyltransferase